MGGLKVPNACPPLQPCTVPSQTLLQKTETSARPEMINGPCSTPNTNSGDEDVHSHNIDAQVRCCGQNAALRFQEACNVRVATRRRRRYARVPCAVTHTRLHAKRLCAAVQVVAPVSRRSKSVPCIWKIRFPWFRCANFHSCKPAQMVCLARLRGSRHPRDGGRWFEKLFLARKKKRSTSCLILRKAQNCLLWII